MSAAGRFADLRSRVEGACRRSGRDPADVRILGAAKTVGPEAVREAYGAGLRLVGENRLQDALPKIEALAGLPGLEWHFIGPIQSRKCRQIAQAFSAVHSVDREKVAVLLDRHAGEAGRSLDVLVEVNLGAERSKSGCSPDAARRLVNVCADLPHLEARGLMDLPPYAEDPEESRPYHRRLRELRDRLAEETGLALPVLSMGMSHDFEVAVEEGATLVRIGTALFGPR